ncbi:hypothetical protein C2W62_23055 [Candidatus Entotheonella serta]|nr:hypothetical protein C2W62_23055 [Candidatus Entotheonella serta]
MTDEAAFLQALASRGSVRPRVAGIVVKDSEVLVQRPVDEPQASYAFVGGEYEWGDTFRSRLQAEFAEETNCRVTRATYLFVVENRFAYNGRLIHSLEHYFDVEIDRRDVQSRETHLSFHWLSLSRFAELDVRPHVVRDVIASGKYRDVRHLVVPY